jgi:glyoxylase-like metal-dependent hydrolase (beta-lactamase superfamily II)
MQLQQLHDPGSSTCSYLIWDESTGEAALIDPVLDQLARDLRMLNERGLTLRYILETHVPIDHITSSGRLRELKKAAVLVPEGYGSKNPDVLLRDNDRIPLGNGRIHVISTPGHSQYAVSYYIPGAVFTGDTLLVGSCGRTDLQSGDAGVLYDSITRRLFTLPGDTVVYPGHNGSGRPFSTIREERHGNPRIGNERSREDFIAIMKNLRLDPPSSLYETLSHNLRNGLSEAESLTA